MTDRLNPTNLTRAAWADGAIRTFRAETGCDHEDSLGDLLCNLMHWADARNFDFEAALLRATWQYLSEFYEERGSQAAVEVMARISERGA